MPLDPVRDVEDLDLGRDHLHHAVAGADEIVLEPEVAEEGDQHVSATLTNRRPRRGRPDRACPPRRRPGGRPTLQRESSEARSRRPGCPPRARRTTVLPTLRRARRDRPPGGSSGRTSRVVYSGTKSAPSSSIGPRRDPSAAAKSTRPVGRGNSARRPSCDETRGTNAGSTPSSRSASAVPGPTAATRGSCPFARADELGGAVRARHDHPVVALDVDGVVRRLDLDQRALDDLVTLLLEAPDERPGLPAGTRDDDLHAARPASSDASAAGSSPVRRSTQRPSGPRRARSSVSPS